MLQHDRLWLIYLKIFLEDTFLRKANLLSREILWKSPKFFVHSKSVLASTEETAWNVNIALKWEILWRSIKRQKRVLFVVGDSLLTSGRQKVMRTEFISESKLIIIWKICIWVFIFGPNGRYKWECFKKRTSESHADIIHIWI